MQSLLSMLVAPSWDSAIEVATLLLTIGAAVHVVRSGRPFYWLWIILFFPVLGAVIYLVSEFGPSIRHVRFGNPLPALLDRLVPGRELARLREHLARSSTVANRQALAEYHVRRGEYDEAVKLYGECLTGVYKDDPELHLALAQVHFLAGRLDEATRLLEQARAIAPKHEAQKRDLLLGRIAEERGEREQAMALYERAREAGPITEEFRVRLARIYEAIGETERAHELYTDVVYRMRGAAPSYRRSQRAWFSEARDRLKRLTS